MSTYSHLTDSELWRIARDSDNALVRELLERFNVDSDELEAKDKEITELLERVSKLEEAEEAIHKIRDLANSY